jgi:hypothetical protein
MRVTYFWSTDFVHGILRAGVSHVTCCMPFNSLDALLLMSLTIVDMKISHEHTCHCDSTCFHEWQCISAFLDYMNL